MIDNSSFEEVARHNLKLMLDKYLSQLKGKLNTIEKCDRFLQKAKDNQNDFNKNMKLVQAAKQKFNKGQISESEFMASTKSARKEISNSCKQLNLRIKPDAIDTEFTKGDINNYREYISNLISGVETIKNGLKPKRVSESVLEQVEDGSNDQHIFNQALESLEAY